MSYSPGSDPTALCSSCKHEAKDHAPPFNNIAWCRVADCMCRGFVIDAAPSPLSGAHTDLTPRFTVSGAYWTVVLLGPDALKK